MPTRKFTRSARQNSARTAGGPARRSWRRWIPFSNRRLLVGGLTVVGVLFLSLAGLILWWSKDLPDPKSLSERQVVESTRIYDRTGTHLLYQFGDVHRTRVTLDKISNLVQQATVAAEDESFYTHHGIDFKGIVRALWNDIRGGNTQGGSTITQQLIKNSILTADKTLQRKIKEAVLAVELEQRFSKNEILELYLNEIPYGNQNYGIESAAQMYFGVSAQNLTLAQAATLAALPQAPSRYSPYGSHLDALKQRQEYVLSRMVSMNVITKEQADNAKKEPLHFQPRRDAVSAPHFVFYVKEQLVEQYGERIVEEGGLKVTTTLDARLEQIAQDVLTNRRASFNKQGISNAALTAVDPKTGDILAMVGSVDYNDESIDGNVNVAIRTRSPGSSIKPFVYAAAFAKGYTPDTILTDVETDFGQGYSPKNFDLKTHGPTSMRQALQNSLNIPAVQTLYLVGIKQATELARTMGMGTLTDPDRYGLSLVLGGGEVTLLDETSAYSVFASEGVRHPARSVLKIENGKGVLFDASEDKAANEGSKVLDPQIARTVSNVLSDNSARALVFGTNSPLQLGARPVAAKTGTTQDFRDGWTLGYTPSLAAGVWVGNNDNSPLKGEPGSHTAAPIWNDFMKQALANTPIERFTAPESPKNIPDGILQGHLPEIKGKWDWNTNTLYTLDCPINIGEPRTIKELHSVLYYVDKNNPLGPPPSDPQRDPQFAKWEAAIATWRDKNNAEAKADPTKTLYVASLPIPICSEQNTEDLPKVQITEPNTTVLKATGNVTVKAQIDSPHPVTQVRFMVDGIQIADFKNTDNLQATFNVPAGFVGRKTLQIVAVTDNNLIGQAHRTFIINPDDSAPVVSLLAPKNGQTVSPASFPYTLKATATDKSGIDYVDFLFRRPDSQSTQRVSRVTTVSPTAANRYEASWHDSPGSGTWDVYAVAYDKTGNTTESAHSTKLLSRFSAALPASSVQTSLP